MPRLQPAFRPIRHRPPPRRDAPSTPPLLEGIAVCSLPSRARGPRCQAGTKPLLQALSQANPNPPPSGILEGRATASSRSHLGGTLAKMAFALPAARQVHHDLPQSELLERALAMPTARPTEYGAPNVQTQVLARSKGSTFIVADDPDSYPHQAIDRDEWQRVTELQNAYIADQEMIVVDGYIGDTAERRVPARLYVEAANANIAGMQDVLYFHDPETGEFEPELLVIYTPNLAVPGYPDDRLIAVNLDLYVTRVFNSDYFGESKKGGLRMWNHLVFERGGLALHAGCKMIPTSAGVKTGLIVGLSGTGKTTTTFTRQNGSLPVQDDFVAWWPDGSISASEAGCFAKTFALNPTDEPTIHGAVTKPGAYLENVSQDDHGVVDFFDESYTKNGRVGGPESESGSKKVRIPHSSAIVKAIAEGTIEWEVDPDFGYKVASHVPGIDAADIDLLQPRRLYEATGRGDEYRQRVQGLKAERAEFLGQYPSLSAEIVNSVR